MNPVRKTLRILFVEDSAADVELASCELRRGGFDPFIEQVSTAKGMRAALQKNDWDLILCDHTLPQFDSSKALEIFRETGLEIPFIVLSGTDCKIRGAEAMRAGAADYLDKDSLVRLVPIVERELRQVKLRHEYRQTEHERREHEIQLRTIVETTPECIKILDHEGNLLQINQAGLDLVECDDPASMLGKSVYPIIAPECRAAFEEMNRKVCAGGKATLQFEIIGLRGTRRWMETTAVPIRRGSTDTRCLLGITRDITALKRTEVRRAVFAELMQKLNLATTPSEAARIILQSAEDLLGWDASSFELYSPEPPSLRPVLNFDTINGERREVTAAYGILPLSPFKRSVLNGGGKLILRKDPFEGTENLIPFGDTERRSSSLIFVPIRNGAKVAGIFSIQSYTRNAYNQEDVRTLQSLANHCGGALDRIAAQEAQSQLMAALDAQGKRVSDLLDNVPGVIWEMWLDPADQRVDFANKYIETLLGYDFEERKSMPSFWKTIMHPDDQEHVVRRCAELISTGGQTTEKFRWIAKDGRVIWVETQVKVVYDPNGKPIGLRGVMLDISERLQLEARLRQSQKMESVGQLAGGIAHDFNNILTVIQGHASLLRISESLTPLQSDSLEQITQAGERATNLTRQLLTFSRRQAMQTRATDLNEVVNQFTRLIARILGEDVSLQLECSPSAQMIHADVGMMEQLLMNLAVNSRDAMPKGGTLTIETSTVMIDHSHVREFPDATFGETVCLTVSDTGCGIPPENLPKIYEPFFTTKSVGKGSGLGLATAYGIVRQHSGWITVESEFGKGTVFRVYFPCSKEKAAPRAIQVPQSAPRGGTETILIVEDEAPLRKLVDQILQKAGYTVLQADSGITALKLYKENRNNIHLLLTDMVMPDGMTGRELAEIIQFDNPEIKVVFTSGYNVEIVGKDFSLHEGVNFVQKPYHPMKLAKAVRDCLDNVRLEA